MFPDANAGGRECANFRPVGGLFARKWTVRPADSVRSTDPAPDQRPVSGGFRPDIEGLRAVAVLAVVLFHADHTEAGGGHYADHTELFCTTDHCPVIVGDTLVYLDQNHLTIEYAQLLAPAIGALADRALAVW